MEVDSERGKVRAASCLGTLSRNSITSARPNGLTGTCNVCAAVHSIVHAISTHLHCYCNRI